MNQQQPPTRPLPAAMPAQDFIAALPRPGHGGVLVLATAPLAGLGSATVAAAQLGHALAHLRIANQALAGRAPVPGIDPVLAEHECRWLAAGDLHERLLEALAAGAPELVLYADPWAANLDDTVVRQAPRARRILIDDLVERVAQDGDYWLTVIDWLAARPGLQFLPTATLLQWSGSVLPATDDAEPSPPIGFEARWGVLIDEHGAHPPTPEVLMALVERHPEGVLLISPHLPWYLENHQHLLERCNGAWRPAELSSATYRGLLARTSRYVAPAGVPYGTRLLAALPADAEVRIPADTEIGRGTGAGWTLHRHRDREDLRQQLGATAMQSDLAGTPGAPTAGEEPPAANRWWRALGTLVAGEPDGAPSRQAPAAAPERSPAPAADGPVEFAFLACCYKYVQRFRIFIDSIVRQDHPPERYEVVLALPGNPDGILEYIDMLRMVHPRLRIRVVELPEEARGNKGKMLNAAFRATSARVVMPTDVDIVFAPDFVRTMLARHRPELVLGCWRTPLAKELTAQILVGNLDPVQHFAVLQQQWDKGEETGGVRQGMLGYCQVVAREAFAAVGYPEEFAGYNQSDIVFIERLQQRAGVASHFMKDYFVLHLSHSRDWTGTKTYL